MKKILSVIQMSAKELKKTSTISITGMLVGISVVLSFLKIVISSLMQISFASLPIAAGGMLYGPTVGALMGVASDILGYFARPNGAFFPGFTLNALIIGLIYGFFFYKKPVTLKRVILASLTITIIINLILTPIWLSMMYGNAFGVLVAGRILKNVVMFPIDTALLMTVLKLVERINLNRKMR